MNPIFALLAPLALLVPTPVGGPAPSGARALVPQPPTTVETGPGPGAVAAEPGEVPSSWQVRIEQRVTIRISPRSPSVRPDMLVDAGPSFGGARLVERKMAKCVQVAGIAAVQPDAGDRLLLFMRDHRLVSASLEKACSAREFYSGFYLERSRDGMLCVDRDKLHSRAGASCEIGRMRQLVAADD